MEISVVCLNKDLIKAVVSAIYPLDGGCKNHSAIDMVKSVLKVDFFKMLDHLDVNMGDIDDRGFIEKDGYDPLELVSIRILTDEEKQEIWNIVRRLLNAQSEN